MKPSTEKALDRVLRKMARPPRRRLGWFSIAPIYLALGMVLAYQLLVRFVPMVWSALLPGGIELAPRLRGWPAVVWRFSVVCRFHFRGVAQILGAAALAGFLVSSFLRPFRFLVWIAAIAVMLIDAGILIVTIITALYTTMQAAGIG